jgi:hypothetical protein
LVGEICGGGNLSSSLTGTELRILCYKQFFYNRCSIQKNIVKMVPIGCPETSVRNYSYTLPNSREAGSSHLLRGGSLKSGKELEILTLIRRKAFLFQFFYFNFCTCILSFV